MKLKRSPAPNVDDRRDQLAQGGGFFLFKDLPEAWRRISTKVCCICRRGEKDGLDGLWEFGPTWLCNEHAHDIIDGRDPMSGVKALEAAAVAKRKSDRYSRRRR